MASVNDVVVEPGGKGLGSRAVAGEHLPVGPLGLQGAVEALDFAVLPRELRTDEHSPGAEGSLDGSDIARPGVAPVVVGRDGSIGVMSCSAQYCAVRCKSASQVGPFSLSTPAEF